MSPPWQRNVPNDQYKGRADQGRPSLLEPIMIEFKNKTFCFTGRLDNFTRDQAFALVKERGGFVENRISQSTRYLVVGGMPGSKLGKARGRSYINIISETEFAAAVLTSSPNFVPRKSINVPKISMQLPEPKSKSLVREFAFDE